MNANRIQTFTLRVINEKEYDSHGICADITEVLNTFYQLEKLRLTRPMVVLECVINIIDRFRNLKSLVLNQDLLRYNLHNLHMADLYDGLQKISDLPNLKNLSINFSVNDDVLDNVTDNLERIYENNDAITSFHISIYRRNGISVNTSLSNIFFRNSGYQYNLRFNRTKTKPIMGYN